MIRRHTLELYKQEYEKQVREAEFEFERLAGEYYMCQGSDDDLVMHERKLEECQTRIYKAEGAVIALQNLIDNCYKE